MTVRIPEKNRKQKLRKAMRMQDPQLYTPLYPASRLGGGINLTTPTHLNVHLMIVQYL